MIDINEISRTRKLKGITWNELAKGLPVTGEALRIAIKRGSIQQEYLPQIMANLGQQNQQNDIKEETVKKAESIEELIAQRVSEIVKNDLKEKDAYVEKILNELMEAAINLLPAVDQIKRKLDKIERDINEGKDLIKKKKM